MRGESLGLQRTSAYLMVSLGYLEGKAGLLIVSLGKLDRNLVVLGKLSSGAAWGLRL